MGRKVSTVAAANRRRGRWWGVLIGAGVLTCAGCCLVVPLLAAAGIAGSGVLLVGAGWLEPIGFALIGLGVAGFVVTRIRARRRQSGVCSSSHADIGCGCARPDPIPPEMPSPTTSGP